MIELIAPPVYALAYAYRGQTLPHVPYPKGLRLPIAYGVMALVLSLMVGNILSLPLFLAAVWIAYQPAPDMMRDYRGKYYAKVSPKISRFEWLHWLDDALATVADNLFVDQIGDNNNVDKFLPRNMVIRHVFSGVVIALVAMWFNHLAAILLIAGHALGGMSYMFRKTGLLLPELLMGLCAVVLAVGVV